VLFRHVDLNQEVPSSVYTAVAQVLTYIYQMRAWKRGEVQVPPAKPKVDVKEDEPVK
jgi:flagellar biosynthetic protein FlhB